MGELFCVFPLDCHSDELRGHSKQLHLIEASDAYTRQLKMTEDQGAKGGSTPLQTQPPTA